MVTVTPVIAGCPARAPAGVLPGPGRGAGGRGRGGGQERERRRDVERPGGEDEPLRPSAPGGGGGPGGRPAARAIGGGGRHAAPATGSSPAPPPAGSFPAGAAPASSPAGQPALPAGRELRGFSVARPPSPRLTRGSPGVSTPPPAPAPLFPPSSSGKLPT